METVTINGILYNVEKSETPADIAARGMKYLADQMTQNKINRTIYIRRPNGTRLYFCNEFNVYGQTVYNKPYPLI